MNQNLTVTLAQTSVSRNPEENLQTARRCLQQAANRGTDLIAFPEMFMARPQEGIPLAAVAEPLDGPFVGALTEMARGSRVGLVCGIWEKLPEEKERAANVVIALGPDGTLLARYHKIHLFDALSIRESDLMSAGTDPAAGLYPPGAEAGTGHLL